MTEIQTEEMKDKKEMKRESFGCRMVLQDPEASGGPPGALRGPLRGAYALR